MITVATQYVNGTTGQPITRKLLRAVDRWGRAVWLDADKWRAGTVGLAAYNRNGSPRWEKGYTGRRADVYHRANIASTEGRT
jgi:hypothetical protein